MYRQGYLDPAHTPSQFSYYPVPNAATYGALDTTKLMNTPVEFFKGIYGMKTDSLIGAAGIAMIVAGTYMGSKKKIAKKVPLTQKQALQLGGAAMTVYGMVQTYRSL